MTKNRRDTDREMKIVEVASLMKFHGWSIERACELVCIEVEVAETHVYRRLKRTGNLPDIPTPEMIRAKCEQLRQAFPRPLTGFGLPALARIREYTSSPEYSEFQENDT